MIETLQQLDQNILLFFNGMHNEFFDNFMYAFSGKFIWIPMYASILFVMFKRFSMRQVLMLALGIALTITLADQICATVIRPVFERMRPSNTANPLSALIHIVNDYRGGRYGFPSCHASNSFALAVYASLMLRHRSFTWFIFGWAIINCYSRMYLGVHYPGDLLVGGIIGAASGFVCYNLTKFVACKTGQNLIAKPDSSLTSFGLKTNNIIQIVAILTIIFILLSSI